MIKGVKFCLILLVFLWSFKGFCQNPPDKPVIDSISIVDGKVHFTWISSNNPDDSLLILRQGFNGFYKIWDTIITLPPFSTQFIDNDNLVNPCIKDSAYIVVAENAIGSTWSDISKPVFLFPPEFEICRTSVKLHWTRYKIAPGVEKYQILADANNSGILVVIDEVPSSDTIYFHQDIQPNTLYSYKIRAVDNLGRTSTSCEHEISTPIFKRPEFLYLRYATIVNNKYIKLEWVPDNRVPIRAFKILRSTDGNKFDVIDSILDNSGFTPDITYDDYLVKVSETRYYYKIIAVDSCKNDAIESNLARTVFLSGKARSDKVNELFWTTYSKWPANDSCDYELFRSNDDLPYSLIGIFDRTNWDDPVSTLGDFSKFTYYVRAVQLKDTVINGISYKDSSQSNSFTLYQETVLVLPSAFDPQSNLIDNQVFKPKYLFPPDKATYYMFIFNKWGEMVFETQDYEGGWDGKIPDGSEAPSDVYAYIVRYQTAKGIIKELKGTVTLVR